MHFIRFINFILIIFFISQINAVEQIKREQELAKETNMILSNQYISKLNKRTSESYFDILLENKTEVNTNGINDELKKLRKQFTNSNYVFDFPYQEMLYMLYQTSLVCYDSKILNKEKDEETLNDTTDKYNQIKDKCKLILQCLILFDAEYYVYNNNKSKLDLLTITDNNINNSIKNIVNGIKQYISRVPSSNNSKAIVVTNEISQEILKQDKDKIKSFYKSYYSVMDNSNFINIPSFNRLSKEFDSKFDYHNWFKQNNTKTAVPYHDHKSLLEWTIANNKKK